MEERLKTWDQSQISGLCSKLHDKIPELLDLLGIEYKKRDNKYMLPCPVHGGDNPNGCTIFEDGAYNWACWTHSCQFKYKKSLLGFVRGVLSYKKGREVSVGESMEFCAKFLNCEIGDIQPVKESTNKKFLKVVEIFMMEPEKMLAVDDKPRVGIPSNYYIHRKYNKDILIEFEIGDSLIEYGIMANRAIVPYYDMGGTYVGCAGRTLINADPKWINSKGLRKSQLLYGIHIAQKYIEETGSIIIVEGPGDVWRLHEAGFKNSVAISGANLSDPQLLSLELSGCLNVIILTDNDDAGKRAAQQIVKKCGRRFNYILPEIPNRYKDIGEMTIEEIQTLLGKN